MGLFYDNLATSVFEMGGELDAYHGRYRYYQAEHGDIDYYLIYGPSIEQVVEKFPRLSAVRSCRRAGRSAIWARLWLTPKRPMLKCSSSVLQNCVNNTKFRAIYSTSPPVTRLDENEKRNVFTWDRSRIPDPEGMVESFARGGIQLTANIKPALLLSHPVTLRWLLLMDLSNRPVVRRQRLSPSGVGRIVSRFHQSANLRVVEAKRAPAAY
jgi:alpha-glucosidase